MAILKKWKTILIICILILLIIVLTVGYYGIFIYPEKQSEKQLAIINAIEREIGLSLPNSTVLHSNSSMKHYTDVHDRNFCRFNLVASFDQKDYDKFISDLKAWEVSGGEYWRAQEQIIEKDPSYYRNWKIIHSHGAPEYDFFLRMMYAGEMHNHAIMIIKDEKK